MNDEILTTLTMRLQNDTGEALSFNKSSLLQGVIMEHIAPDYAAKLHENGRKPYSQCVLIDGDSNLWQISTLNRMAREGIITPLLDKSFNGFTLEHNDLQVRIMSREVQELPITDLFASFYSEDAERAYNIDFQSPTAFKRDGGYVFQPDIGLVYHSLVSKLDCVLEKEGMYSQETLEQLKANTEITAFSLYSVKYSLEGIKIPAFMGKISIRIRGPQTMANFAKLLFRFGNYSGIGIKTALGMGHVIIQPKRRQINSNE